MSEWFGYVMGNLEWMDARLATHYTARVKH